MADTPFINFWYRMLGDRKRRGLPPFTHVYLHPRDLLLLEDETLRDERLRYTMRHGPRGMASLFDTFIRSEKDVAEGWLVAEAERSQPGLVFATHQFRCLKHEDCIRAPELGLACRWRELTDADPKPVTLKR